MIVVERNKIELDYCTTCGGIWFGSGELELLLASLDMAGCSTFVGAGLKSVETRSGERPRRCPVCAQKMQKSHIGEQPKVLIDACQRSHGLWFDGGELSQLLDQLAKNPEAGPTCDAQVQTFLKDTFRSHDRRSA